MKILIVMTTPYSNDGISNIVKSIYNNLEKDFFSVDFIFPNKPDDKFINYLFDYQSKYFILKKRNKNPVEYMRQLWKIIKNKNYDIIHVHGNSSTMAVELWIAKMLKIPVRIAHVHSIESKFPRLNKVLRPLLNNTKTHAFAVSDKSGKWLFGLDYNLLENGISAEKFQFNEQTRMSTRDSLGYSDDDIIIGNIGRFSPEKNQVYLIKLLSKLIHLNNNFKLLLVGNGNTLSSVQEVVREMNLDKYCIFAGVQEDIPSYLMAMDVLIVPSLFEGFGLTLLEGQASDLKCFASTKVPKDANVTGNIEYFNLDEMDYLIKKIIDFFETPQKTRSNLVLNSEIIESSYNIKNTVAKLSNNYKLYFKNSSKNVK